MWAEELQLVWMKQSARLPGAAQGDTATGFNAFTWSMVYKNTLKQHAAHLELI